MDNLIPVEPKNETPLRSLNVWVLSAPDLTGSRGGLDRAMGRMLFVRWVGPAELLASTLDGEHPVDASAVAIAAALPVRDRLLYLLEVV